MYVPLNDLGYGNKRRQSEPMSQTTVEGKVGLARKLAPIIFCGDPTVMLLCAFFVFSQDWFKKGDYFSSFQRVQKAFAQYCCHDYGWWQD